MIYTVSMWNSDKYERIYILINLCRLTTHGGNLRTASAMRQHGLEYGWSKSINLTNICGDKSSCYCGGLFLSSKRPERFV